MSEFGYWTFGGKNGLYGGETTVTILPDGRPFYVKDPDAPAVLEDSQILWALENDNFAIHSFFALLPTMDPISQGRLRGLVERYPSYFIPKIDPSVQNDIYQRKEVTAGVRTQIPKPVIRGRLS